MFQHTIRRPAAHKAISDFGLVIQRSEGDKGTDGSPPKPPKIVAHHSPTYRVHIDDTSRSAPNHVKRLLPDEPELLKGRIQIINVWRPIAPILRDPLALCDSQSVPESDLVPFKIIWSTRETEAYAVKPNPNHSWHYAYNMTPDEVMLIKICDSKTDGRSRGTPHSAFKDEELETETMRESLEVRVLAFHPDDTD